ISAINMMKGNINININEKGDAVVNKNNDFLNKDIKKAFSSCGKLLFDISKLAGVFIKQNKSSNHTKSKEIKLKGRSMPLSAELTAHKNSYVLSKSTFMSRNTKQIDINKHYIDIYNRSIENTGAGKNMYNQYKQKELAFKKALVRIVIKRANNKEYNISSLNNFYAVSNPRLK
ncbi:hypothetical protein ACFL4O_00735, partial [bacterium]